MSEEFAAHGVRIKRSSLCDRAETVAMTVSAVIAAMPMGRTTLRMKPSARALTLRPTLLA